MYSEYLELDLSTVVPSIAGPKRPQDRIVLTDAKDPSGGRHRASATVANGEGIVPGVRSGHPRLGQRVRRRLRRTSMSQVGPPTRSRSPATDYSIGHGIVSIASITSCTNTSNPSVMMAAGLLARNAANRGLNSKPWVKTSMAPGSQVVTNYYTKAGLMARTSRQLSFYLVGYGCTTCIGNSGPLDQEISRTRSQEKDLAVTAVLSGNRNFEGRINPDVKMNYLASPPLVIAYALAGTMDFDFENDSLGND